MSQNSFTPPVDSDGDIVMTDDNDNDHHHHHHHHHPPALRRPHSPLPAPSRDSAAQAATPANRNNNPLLRLWRITGCGANPVPSTQGPPLTIDGVDVAPPTHQGIPTDAILRFYTQSRTPEPVTRRVESPLVETEPGPRTARTTGTGRFCVACMDELSSDEFRVECGCLYCVGCLNAVFRAGCESRASFPPRCCGVALRISAWGSVLEDDVVRRYKMVEAEFACTRPLYCAAARCSAFVPETGYEGRAARCPACERETCRECRRLMDEHDVEFHRNDPPGHPGHPVCPKATRGEKALLRLGKEKKWPRCPSCQTMIERNEGCDHMECVCGVEFCYRCGELFDEDDWCGCELRGQADSEENSEDEDDEDEDEEDSETSEDGDDEEEEEENEDEDDSETNEDEDDDDDDQDEEDVDTDEDDDQDEDEEDVIEEDDDEWPDHRLAMDNRRGGGGGGCLHDEVMDGTDETGICHGCLGTKVLYTCAWCRIELCDECLNRVARNV
ncbi:hypothetical protein H2204_002361 [Knufia peltigerae]|uniref:RBR-type E3 ubiquitin transferase n=1 Tax=Knufia peltigerae TaxID=1002370 RepID=A0AA39D0L2_9EURO|nr:hypothetical protein H2204_002361 [Knufia peltigerae]